MAEKRLPDIRLRQFGFVFQDFNLLSALTALENVVIVAKLAGTMNGEARKKAAALLTGLGLGERLNFLPEKLSGSEKRRVAIARALVNDPALILADEPTANLDSKIGQENLRMLGGVRERAGAMRGEECLPVYTSPIQRTQDTLSCLTWLCNLSSPIHNSASIRSATAR